MIVFTIAANNYIPKARILAKSVKKHNPAFSFTLVLCDGKRDDFPQSSEPFDNILYLEDLGIPNLDAWTFKHTVVELCTAGKAASFQKISQTTGEKKIIYLDPDIVVFDTLDPIVKLLDDHKIILTPHLITPEKTPESIEDNEICALQHGIYNLGFLAIYYEGEGKDCIEWWNDRLMLYCQDDIPRGLFTDQRWMDLVPAFFEKVHVLRKPIYNVATWNISYRPLCKNNDGEILIDGKKLGFYHFTGFDSGAGIAMMKKYGKSNAVLSELFDWYEQEMEKEGQSRFGSLPPVYSFFKDGKIIKPVYRQVYRISQKLQEKFPNPYEITSIQFKKWVWFYKIAHCISYHIRCIRG